MKPVLSLTAGFAASFAVAILLVISPSLVVAQTPSLQLRAQFERPVVELGEPVYLTVRLLNHGDTPVLLPVNPLDPQDGTVAVGVRDPHGRGVGYVPQAVTDRDASIKISLAPRQQVATTFPIFFGATGWVFQTPGRYSVRVHSDLRLAEGQLHKLDAVTLYIDVLEGSDATRRLVNGDAVSLQAGRFLDWRGGDQLTEGRALLEQISAATPRPAVADYYHVAAARSWMRPFKDYRVGKVRPADPARGLAESRRVVNEANLPGAVRVEMLLARSGALIDLRQPGDAATALKLTRGLIVDRAELEEYTLQLERLERTAGSAR